jgi:uncharacterized protein YjbI with pentapeptide repeats
MRLFAALLAIIVLLIILRDLLPPLLYHPGLVVGTVAAVAAIVVLIRVGQHYEWTGFGESSHPKSDSQEVQPGKTLWDWLQLLIVPLALALIVVVWSTVQEDQRQQQIEDIRARQAQRIEAQRAEAQRELAVQQAQDEALQAYLDVMKELLLEQDLRDSGPDSNARAVANVQTLLILEQVDSVRKTVVLRLLTDSHLIDTDAPLIETSTLSLQEANAEGRDLTDTDLSGADLDRADLRGADLSRANLSYASLIRADLSRAVLAEADLRGAKGVTNEQLEQQARSLEGATMPNGQKYEDWLKSKDNQEDG